MKKSLKVFGFTYLFLYIFPFPFERFFGKVFDPLVFFVGKTVLNLKTVDPDISYSGDRTYDYVKLLVLLLLSILFGALFQTVLRKRMRFERIRDTSLLYAQYFVGLTVIQYGVAKLCDAQFTAPSYMKLESTFGNSSPMGLMWAFMGASKPYYIFVGLLQVLSGTLVLFKRTKTLGSLLTFVIMLNVVVMNFCYDVPAKLLSCHILLLSVVIIAREIKTILSFFLLRTPQQLPDIQPGTGKYRRTKLILKTLFIGGFVFSSVYQYMAYAFSEGTYSGKNGMDGVYTAELFIAGSDTIARNDPGATRWKTLMMSRGFSKLINMQDSSEVFKVRIDSVTKTITFIPKNENGEIQKLNYITDDRKLELRGLWKGKNMTAIFSKKTYDDYPLTNRGFHWINETIYNR